MTSSQINSNEKQIVRNRNLEIRNSVGNKQRTRLSKDIIENLIHLDHYRKAASIHTYVPIDKNMEIDTIPLIETSLEEGKKVIVPKMKASGTLSHHQIDSIDSLVPNKFGVPEPETSAEADLSDCSLIIVPMVAADFDRNRLGYGKGYYDRFLSEMTAPRIGLCYSFNLQWNPLPTEDFDEKLDLVLTENLMIE